MGTRRINLPGTRRSNLLPSVLKGNFEIVDRDKDTCHFVQRSTITAEELNQKQNNWKIGAFYSGSTVPLQYEVVYGIWDYFRTHAKDTTFYMFEDGPMGLIEFNFIESNTTDSRFVGEECACGFEYINGKRGRLAHRERGWLAHEKEVQKVEDTVRKLDLDALVVIGGDDATLNAEVLAEHFKTRNVKTLVVGCPIDSSVNCNIVSPCFRIDNISKTYSQMIDKIRSSAQHSSGQYHFLKLTGCVASHITLNCTLQSRPNIALIGEEIYFKRQTLKDIRDQIVNVICKRSALGHNYGVILIPEHLFYFIPEVRKLMVELSRRLKESLNRKSLELFNSLPLGIQEILLLQSDPCLTLAVENDFESFLVQIVKTELENKKKEGLYDGDFNGDFRGITNILSVPRLNNSAYCYSLGYAAGALIQSGKAGLTPQIGNLTKPVEEWVVYGIPLAYLVDKTGKFGPVMKKSWVDLQGKLFKNFAQMRDKLEIEI